MPNDFEEIPDKFIGYIKFKKEFYYVKKKSKNSITTFGKFNSVKEACAATSILLKNKWKLSEVSKNPLVTYDREFWIFEVKDEKLVFDKKFSDFELAVEYVEINARCNDYHNDIFRNSSKKNGYKERFKFPKQEEKSTSDKYIFEDDSGKFIVKKSKRKNSPPFGKFDSFDMALAARKLLVDSKWNVKDGNEILFFNDMYWIFEIDYNFLKFKGKSDSYEDAMDIINPPNPQDDEFNNPYMQSIEENFDKVMANRKSKSFNHRKVSSEAIIDRKLNNINIVKNNVKIKSEVDIERIWDPKIMINKMGNKQLRIFVEGCGDNVNNLSSVLDFSFFKKRVTCVVDGDEIPWGDRNKAHISNFPEFQLIINILEVNGWNLSKISNSSSIHFFNHAYYKIHIVDNNKIIFGKFISYDDAENTLLTYNNIPVLSVDSDMLGIDKVGDYYKLIKFQNGELYNTMPLKSLEEIKAIRDILMHANWNFSIFDNYDLFYLNGFYWELGHENNVIYFINKYELIKTL